MTREELAAYCLQYEDAAPFAPFDEDKLIIRHKSNGKWFALIMTLDGRLCINLKCDPIEADMLRRAYRGVTPGWHMNKTHWNTVAVDTDVPQQELLRMIGESFRLTAPRASKR
ncbi:MmcQ/YjbR family DNA-binding protein [Candidatus Soleaferrea massiliensis]|uniref:MmcQ/YjbR family DNA-binding protein n=1 Tax=Candidatus Soleaferrea massiliensis TaxID=1470354 RepID=UPI00058E48F9|nr:MmcQ/YjbR family DNA-binding protein [Candidatus Soleaferrea massiliensis]